MKKFQNVWNEQMAQNRDESDETQSEYYDSESKRSRRQKSVKCNTDFSVKSI